MKQEKNKIVKIKESLEPLYRKGDLFRIIKINTDKDLVPVVAVRLKDNVVYGFEGDEFEDGQ